MYTDILQNHLADYQDKPLAQFTPSPITYILTTAKAHDRKGRVLGNAEIRLKKQLRSTLDSLFEDAKKKRIILSNPAEKLPIPQSKDAQYKEVGRERTAFSMPEMESMLRAATAMPDKAEGARMRFRLLTGMR